MSENDDLHSGSRWEPQPAAQAPAPEWRSAAEPYEPPAAEASEAPPGTGRPTGRARRGVLAGAGTGILLIGGIGGFAIGHAVAATGSGATGDPAVVRNGVPGQNGVPGEGFGDGDGLHHRFGDGDGDGGGFGRVPPGRDDGTTGGNA